MSRKKKTNGYKGIEMTLEVKPGVKKKYIIGKLSPEEIELVESDLRASKEAREKDFVVGGIVDIKL